MRPRPGNTGTSWQTSNETEGNKGEKAVEHKQLIAKGVVQIVGAEPLDSGTKQGRGNCNEWNELVADGTAGDEPEGK